jgi:hypothetical protein
MDFFQAGVEDGWNVGILVTHQMDRLRICVIGLARA